MKLIETIKLALTAIWVHKLRSFLTLLGMIIGVTAFIVVVSLIQGFNVYVDEKIAGIGSKSFSVQRFNPFEDFKDVDTIAAAQRRNKDLTLDDFEYLKSRMTLAGRIGAKSRSNTADIKRDTYIVNDVSVTGATPVTADIDNLEIGEGRFFADPENDAGMRVAFIGSDIAKTLFPTGTAVGQEITVRGIPYRVVGVAAPKGTVFGIPQDNFVTLPLKSFVKGFGPLRGSRSLYFVITAKDDKRFNDTVDEARFLMRLRRAVPANEKDNFGIVTPDAITGLRDRIFGSISFVAMVVPGIALIVGAIVIMNIMLVAVTERTREIGIRKSLGARQGDILKQFLLESITMSVIGGTIGLTLAWIIGRIITVMVSFPTYLSVGSVILAIGVSTVVGILAGIIPAWKAARLDPIEALRAD
ncbi:MAG: ABC transporter permease [Pyrinomonadaceae bacterium]